MIVGKTRPKNIPTNHNRSKQCDESTESEFQLTITRNFPLAWEKPRVQCEIGLIYLLVVC